MVQGITSNATSATDWYAEQRQIRRDTLNPKCASIGGDVKMKDDPSPTEKTFRRWLDYTKEYWSQQQRADTSWQTRHLIAPVK